MTLKVKTMNNATNFNKLKINDEFKLLVMFGIVGIIENVKDITEKQYLELKEIYMSLSDDIDAMPDDKPDEPVIQEFIESIYNVQCKLEAYDDLEYEGE